MKLKQLVSYLTISSMIALSGTNALASEPEWIEEELAVVYEEPAAEEAVFAEAEEVEEVLAEADTEEELVYADVSMMETAELIEDREEPDAFADASIWEEEAEDEEVVAAGEDAKELRSTITYEAASTEVLLMNGKAVLEIRNAETTALNKNLRYTWVAIDEKTWAETVISDGSQSKVTVTKAGEYVCQIIDTYGESVTQRFRVAPFIMTEYQDKVALVNGSAVLKAPKLFKGSTAPVTYKWYQDYDFEHPLPVLNSSQLTVRETDIYHCKITMGDYSELVGYEVFNTVVGKYTDQVLTGSDRKVVLTAPEVLGSPTGKPEYTWYTDYHVGEVEEDDDNVILGYSKSLTYELPKDRDKQQICLQIRDGSFYDVIYYWVYRFKEPENLKKTIFCGIKEGTPVTLQAAAYTVSDPQNLTYLWYTKDGKALGTNKTLEVTQPGLYYCAVNLKGDKLLITQEFCVGEVPNAPRPGWNENSYVVYPLTVGEKTTLPKTSDPFYYKFTAPECGLYECKAENFSEGWHRTFYYYDAEAKEVGTPKMTGYGTEDGYAQFHKGVTYYILIDTADEDEGEDCDYWASGTLQINFAKEKHDLVIDVPAVAPTVLQGGFTACKKCGWCDKLLSVRRGTNKLPATGKLNASGTLPLKRGQKISLSVSDLQQGDKVISWTSSDKKTATVDENGVVKGIKAGKKAAVITATLLSGKKLTVNVKVQNADVACQKLTVNQTGPLKLAPKKTFSLKVSAKYPITCKQKVTYASSNKKVAVVSKTGKVKAVGKGNATISVRCGKKTVKVKVVVLRKN